MVEFDRYSRYEKGVVIDLGFLKAQVKDAVRSFFQPITALAITFWSAVTGSTLKDAVDYQQIKIPVALRGVEAFTLASAGFLAAEVVHWVRPLSMLHLVKVVLYKTLH
jgi:hypothetical protein